MEITGVDLVFIAIIVSVATVKIVEIIRMGGK